MMSFETLSPHQSFSNNTSYSPTSKHHRKNSHPASSSFPFFEFTTSLDLPNSPSSHSQSLFGNHDDFTSQVDQEYLPQSTAGNHHHHHHQHDSHQSHQQRSQHNIQEISESSIDGSSSSSFISSTESPIFHSSPSPPMELYPHPQSYSKHITSSSQSIPLFNSSANYSSPLLHQELFNQEAAENHVQKQDMVAKLGLIHERDSVTPIDSEDHPAAIIDSSSGKLKRKICQTAIKTSSPTPISPDSLHSLPSTLSSNSSTLPSKPPLLPPKKRRSKTDLTLPTANSVPSLLASSSISSSDDREEVKKAKHREIDAARRAREAAAVIRLQSVLDQIKSIGSEEEQNSIEKEKEKKDKVTTLESAAERILQLESLLYTAQKQLATEKTKANQLATHLFKITQNAQNLLTSGAASSSDPFSVLPAQYRDHIHQLERSSTLYQSIFFNSSLILLLLSVKTGRCVDANAAFCKVTGWKKEQVEGRIFCPEGERLLHDEDPDIIIRSPLDRPPVYSHTTKSKVPAPKQKQYAGIRGQLVRLYTGQVPQVTCIFRIVLSRGNLVDVRCNCWLGKGEEEEEDTSISTSSSNSSSSDSSSSSSSSNTQSSCPPPAPSKDTSLLNLMGSDGLKPKVLIIATTEADVLEL